MNQNPKTSRFHEADPTKVDPTKLGAVKARKSSFAGTIFHQGDEWTIERSAWILPPDASETDEDAKLFPGFIVKRNGKEETLMLSTLLRPTTTYEGEDLVPEGTANVRIREIFDGASTDDEALNRIVNEIHKIVVKRDREYNAYLKSTGKSRPNSKLLEFNL